MKKIIFLFILIGLVSAEVRTYRQIKDVATRENGSVVSSQSKGNLFEFTYDIDREQGIVTRIKIRRLDQTEAVPDNTQYTIMQNKMLLGSVPGGGGNAIMAVEKNGSEIISLGDNVAFTSRTSDFAQMITGVYERL